MVLAMSQLERVLLWIIRIGIVLILFTPFIVAKSLFFPFITGKNFYFRIITELIFGAWLALACLNPTFRPRKSPLLFALLAFILVLILATILGADPYHSFWSNFERMEGLVTHIHLFALFLVLAHSVRGSKEWAVFLVVSLSVSAVEAFHGFLQSTGTLEIVGGGRVFAGFGNSIYLSVYLMFHLFFAAVLFLRSRVPWVRSLCALLFFVELYVFFQSASRGAFIGFTVGVALAAALFIIFSKSRVYRVAGLACIVLVVLLGALIIFAPQSALIQKSELLSRLSGVSFKSISNDPRVMIWGVALDAARARPILGWGPENFIIPFAQFYNPNLFGNEPWFDRAHNMLLEWFVAAGIIGLIVYLAIFLSVGWIIYRLMHMGVLSQSEAVIVVSLVVAYIVQNIFVFDNIVTYIIIFTLFAFLHSSYVFRDVRESSRRTKQPLALVGAATAVVASIVLSYMLNARPLYAARQIIVSLESLRGNGAEYIIREFERAIVPKTLGTTEARERVADTVVQIALSGGQTNKEFDKLLDYGIAEMEKEIASSPSPRIPLFLGKLYTIRVNLTGRDIDKAEAMYQTLEQRAPNYIQTYLGLAELYLVANRPQKAVEMSLKAYRLLDKKETLGALFFPVFSVHLLAGSYDEALGLVYDYRKRTNLNPPFAAKDQIELIIQRSRAGDQTSKLRLFEELHRIFFEMYHYPQPLLLQHIIDMYRLAGNNVRPNELLKIYATPEMIDRARQNAEAERNPRNEEYILRFISVLESLK